MKLTSKKVREIFMDSLFKDGEDRNNAIIVRGITINVGFNPDSIKRHADEILELLNELPDNFKEEIGGGWSFLEAAFDKDGNHWGEHRNMEELFLLGIAIGKVDYLLPREVWCNLPGGCPYLVIKNK